MEFTPTLRRALTETTLGTFITIAAVFLITYFAISQHLLFSIALSILTGLAAFTYFTRRFLTRAPARITSNDDGLIITNRTDTDDTVIPWNAITQAVYEDELGPSWILAIGNKNNTVVLHDDGLTKQQWRDLNQAVEHQLNARDIPITRD